MATQNLQLTLPPFNANNWNNPLNGNFSILDSVAGNTFSIVVAAGTDYFLKATDMQNLRINVTGNIGGADTIVNFPANVGGSWIITNNAFSSGGKLSLRTAGATIPSFEITPAASLLVFSDGRNLYSISAGGGGGTGNYLPLTGGTITGDLAVNSKLGVGGAATFNNDVSIPNGNTTIKNLSITGTFNLAQTNIAAASVAVNNGSIIGSQKFGVAGGSNLNGDVDVYGYLKLNAGSLIISSASAVNTLSGTTNIPASSSLTIKDNSTFTVENGARISIPGDFTPTSITTSKIVNTGESDLQAVKCNKTLSVTQLATFSGGIQGGGGCRFADPEIYSESGYSTMHFNPGGSTPEGGITCTNTSAPVIGFVSGANPDPFRYSAYMLLNTGRWFASGGVGIGLNGPVAQALAAYCPSAVVGHESCGSADGSLTQALSLEDVIVKMVEEIASLRGEITALKNR